MDAQGELPYPLLLTIVTESMCKTSASQNKSPGSFRMRSRVALFYM